MHLYIYVYTLLSFRFKVSFSLFCLIFFYWRAIISNVLKLKEKTRVLIRKKTLRRYLRGNDPFVSEPEFKQQNPNAPS